MTSEEQVNGGNHGDSKAGVISSRQMRGSGTIG